MKRYRAKRYTKISLINVWKQQAFELFKKGEVFEFNPDDFEEVEEVREKLDNDTIYKLAEISGFLLGMSSELGERRAEIAKSLSNDLKKINEKQLQPVDELRERKA